MCDQLSSGRNGWWLLIKLSIPLCVIQPLQTHPPPTRKKGSEKILSYLTTRRLPHNISSDQNTPRPPSSNTHTHAKIIHGLHSMLLLPSLQQLRRFAVRRKTPFDARTINLKDVNMQREKKYIRYLFLKNVARRAVSLCSTVCQFKVPFSWKSLICPPSKKNL